MADFKPMERRIQEWMICNNNDKVTAFGSQMPFAEPHTYLQSQYFAQMNADPFFGRFLPHTPQIAQHLSSRDQSYAMRKHIDYGFNYGFSKL